MSTTRTTTPSTMTPVTLSWLQWLNTMRNIEKRMLQGGDRTNTPSLRPGKPPRSGTEARKVGLGIPSMGEKLQPGSPSKLPSVSSVERRTSLKSLAGFALTSASQHGDGLPGWTWLKRLARSVVRLTRLLNTSRTRLALEAVPSSSEPAGLAVVYPLKVPGAGHYVAQGVIVSNCDALRYALARDMTA